jgi:DNA processing protein
MPAPQCTHPEGDRTTAIALAHWILLTLAEGDAFPWQPILADLAADPLAWRNYPQVWAWLQQRLAADPTRAHRHHELDTPQMAQTLLRSAAAMAQLGITALVDGDAGYPPRLHELARRADVRRNARIAPPMVLYVRGDPAVLSYDRAVAIVGTRQPTAQGLAHAQALAEALARRGYAIVSGLAIGIDAAAHCGALAAKGCTIAVLATPLTNVYPKVHRELAEEIACHGGALVSEWPAGWRTATWHFPLRNRIQSGLSQAVVVVETRAKGGTMQTVQAAIAQRRPVFLPSPAVFGDTRWESDDPGHPRSGLAAIVQRYRQTGLIQIYDHPEHVLSVLDGGARFAGVQERLF